MTEDDLWSRWKTKYQQHSRAIARDKGSYSNNSWASPPLQKSPVTEQTSPRPRPSLQRYALRTGPARKKDQAQETKRNTSSKSSHPPFVTLGGDDTGGTRITLSFAASKKGGRKVKVKKKRKVRRSLKMTSKNRIPLRKSPVSRPRGASESKVSSAWSKAPSPFARLRKKKIKPKAKTKKTKSRVAFLKRRAAFRKKIRAKHKSTQRPPTKTTKPSKVPEEDPSQCSILGPFGFADSHQEAEQHAETDSGEDPQQLSEEKTVDSKVCAVLVVAVRCVVEYLTSATVRA